MSLCRRIDHPLMAITLPAIIALQVDQVVAQPKRIANHLYLIPIWAFDAEGLSPAPSMTMSQARELAIDVVVPTQQ
jgi:hypothetical protein